MGIEIAQIENRALRTAAEKADSQGNKDGQLDNEEMNVFAKTAYTESNTGFYAKDIFKITGKDNEDEKLKTTLNKIKACEEKREELASSLRILKDCEAKYDAMKNSLQTKPRFGVIGGIIGGVLGATARVPNIKYKAATAVLGIIAGVLAGAAVSRVTNKADKNAHITKEEVEEFKKTKIDPLKESIAVMEIEVAELKQRVKE